MKTQEVKSLQFVQQKNLGLRGFGIVEESFEQYQTAHVMKADMPEDFGITELSFRDFDVVGEEAIRFSLQEIENDISTFVYFIIQLNDISELSAYHIAENEFIANVRKTNDVCIELAQ